MPAAADPQQAAYFDPLECSAPILFGQDDCAHLAAVIDCHEWKIIDYEFEVKSLAQKLEWSGIIKKRFFLRLKQECLGQANALDIRGGEVHQS